MTPPGHIAVIDIGKTNAKLVLVDPATLSEVEVITRPNTPLPGPPYPHFDVKAHWEFLLDGLQRFAVSHGIAAISVTTHGACVALLDSRGALAAPILDYEHDGPDALADRYRAIRPDFGETGSPHLAGGLTVGAQLFWQFDQDPNLLDRVASLVTYPQYWGHRLTGVAATDVTSLGCHTDLWNPHKGTFSSLVATLGLRGKVAPPQPSNAVLGQVLPEVAARTGLDVTTPVYCGIHDSNASLLPHILRNEPPFSVISTGTWVIAMAVGGRSVRLDPALDTLVNVNARGEAVPSARFMGGREHDLALEGKRVVPTARDVGQVLDAGVMLLPSLVPETGPFKGAHARWVGTPPATGSGARTVVTDFYLALVTAHALDLIDRDGPIIVEGPFAQNDCYVQMLSAATRADVLASRQLTGTSQGAALLVAGEMDREGDIRPVRMESDMQARFSDYARRWRGAVSG